jgi:macrolide-specific efflux system membrane fusion protein
MNIKRISRKFFWLIVLAGAVLLFRWIFPPSEAKGGLQIVREIKVCRGELTVKVTTTGEVKPYNRVEIKPPIAGRVEEILVEEGDPVQKGQILAWMSGTERATLLDAARIRGPEEFKKWEEAYKPAPLISPLDGTLIVRSVEPGQTVQPTNPVVVVSDRLIVEALVDETDLSMIKLGQGAEVRLDAYPDRIIPAKVDHITYESKLQNNVNVYTVDVIPDNIPDTFRSGMTANITFLVARLENVLLVPSEAVTEWPAQTVKPKGAEFAVYVKAFGGKLNPVPVRIGQTDGRMTEITEGVSENMPLQIVRKKQSQSATPFSPFGQQKKDNKGRS